MEQKIDQRKIALKKIKRSRAFTMRHLRMLSCFTCERPRYDKVDAVKDSCLKFPEIHKISGLHYSHTESEFTTLLHTPDSEALIIHLSTLSPSQLDYSLRTMSLLSPFTKRLNFVRMLTAHL